MQSQAAGSNAGWELSSDLFLLARPPGIPLEVGGPQGRVGEAGARLEQRGQGEVKEADF